MARKIIDIGVIGNDGTGDSIRDSFRKVNDNFRELYSSLGLGERLTLVGLGDTPDSYAGQENSVLAVNSTETGIQFKQITAGEGIILDYTSNANEIIINSQFSAIASDPSPQLGGNLSAKYGGNQYRIRDLTTPITPDEAVNKAYADSKIARAGADAIDPTTGLPNSAFGRMSGPLILSRDPEPDDDAKYDGLVAATKRYVDSAGFGSSTNLYVSKSGKDYRPGLAPELQGRALSYAYRTIEAALKRAEEIMLESKVDIGPYKKVLTYNKGASACTLSSIDAAPYPLSGIGFEADALMSIDNITLKSQGANYSVGDIITIAGGTIATGGQAARVRVISTLTSPGAISAFEVLSTGVYLELPGIENVATTTDSTYGFGATFDITYKVNNVKIRPGKNGSEYKLVSVRITGGGGSGAFGTAEVVNGSILSVTVTDQGSGFVGIPTVYVDLPRFSIFTNGLRTDFTGDVTTDSPLAVRGRDIREGLYLRGEESGALAQILSHTGELDSLGNEIFDVDIKSGAFIIGEAIAYGDITKRDQISVIVETGVYEENYPLKVPQNVAIIGDEFRRVIIKPKKGTSSSPWALQKFRRDLTIDGNQTARDLFGYHYLTDSTQPVYPKINNKGSFRATAKLLELNKKFIQEEVIAWIDQQILINAAPFSNFTYNSDLCKRDVGLLLDAMIFDLRYGEYYRTVSAALKYFQEASALGDPAIAIGEQLSQTLAAIDKVNSLAQSVIVNDTISPLYQNIAIQIIDNAYIKETNAEVVFLDLINVVKDIIDNSGSVNLPKDNDRMDVFLCNDATIVRAVTCQGHGGFMGVLDHVGQILAKSPYFQECASFSRSINKKTFAGGLFSDGFTGNLQFLHSETVSGTNNTRIVVNKLERLPNLPASCIINDAVYRINYIRDFSYNPAGSTATFVLDETTPFPFAAGLQTCTISIGSPATITKSNHGLQPGATIVFSTTGSLPTGITAGVEYYVLPEGLGVNSFRVSAIAGSSTVVNTSGTQSGTQSYQRVYELLMPGNRSMLANDYTQVNDLGYGLVTTNGGLLEAVSVFTYYCQISYYSINGGQIRSVGGSSAHGNFALVAEGSDPLEIPTPVSLYLELSQSMTIIANTIATQNAKGSVILYGQYTDYFPLPGSEIEVNHTGSIFRYPVTGVTLVDEESKIVQLSLSTAGGLEAGIPHGTIVTIRQNSYVVLTGNVIDTATRPSTALRLQDSRFIYRVLDFSPYSQGYDYDVFVVTNITLETVAKITTDVPHRQLPGYNVQFILDVGASLPVSILGDIDANQAPVYYVREVIDQYTFTISTTKEGTPVNTSGDSAFTGRIRVKPFGLALTQLRENHDYIEIGVYTAQPFRNPNALTNCTFVPGLPGTINATNHGLTAGTEIRFTNSEGGDLPPEISDSKHYWVVNEDLLTNSFKISETAPIDSTLIGVDGILSGTTITGLTSTKNLKRGMRLIPRPNISQVSIVGDGSVATATFAKQQVPPFLKNQEIIISGSSATGYNGSHRVISCTTTTITFSTTQTGAGTDATISTSSAGNLGTNPTILSVESATTIQISTSGQSNGSIVFGVEGSEVDITLTGQYTKFGRLIGDQDQSTIAVIDLGTTDTNRITNGIDSGFNYKFTWEGQEYKIVGYQPKSALGQTYSLITVSPAFKTSPIRFNENVTFKGHLPVPSEYSKGSLTIRIALTRVTSHDLLEIGTGGYADTNYPNEIYGPAVNDFNSVSLFATDTDDNGAVVLRAQMQERNSGRTFFVTTDQYGNFNVGPFFRVDQGTGTITFQANIALSQIDGLGFKRGATISEFSVDDSMADAAVDAVPTESAVRGYIERRLGLSHTGQEILPGQLIPIESGGFMPLNGLLPMKGDMNLGEIHRIIKLADPINPQDAVNLRSLTTANLQDFDLTNTKANDLLVLSGVGGQVINVSVVGDINFNIDSTANTIDAQINPGVIINADINPAAAIDQTKLSLDNTYATLSPEITGVSAVGSGSAVTLTFATQTSAPYSAGQRIIVSGFSIAGFNGVQTVVSCTTGTLVYSNSSIGTATGGSIKPFKGISSFDTTQFTVTDGWVTIKNNGLPISKITQIGAKTFLGNNGVVPGNVAEIPFSTLVDAGGSIKKTQYTATGFLRRTNSISNTTDSDYSIIEMSAAYTGSTDNNKLIVRDTNGDFGANVGDLKQLKIDGRVALDTATTATGGYVRLSGYENAGGIYITDGSLASDKITQYWNNTHVFKTQNGLTDAPITASSVQCQVLTTGGNTTAGTITGRWTLTGTSPNESRLQATYSADLAEYYEGDKEYEVGTVLIFGGEKEVTISNKKEDTRVAGVVSNTAAFVMYDACPGFKNLVALQGRVPCKVVGKINKGDILVTSQIQGVAVAATGDVRAGTIVGKALQTYDSDHIGTIEIAVGRT